MPTGVDVPELDADPEGGWGTSVIVTFFFDTWTEPASAAGICTVVVDFVIPPAFTFCCFLAGALSSSESDDDDEDEESLSLSLELESESELELELELLSSFLTSRFLFSPATAAFCTGASRWGTVE